MTRRTGSRQVLLFSAVLALLVGFGGCSSERSDSNPLAVSPKIPGGGGGPLVLASEFLVHAPDLTLAAAVVQQEGGTVVQTLEDVGVLLVTGAEDLDDKVTQRSAGSIIIEPPIQVDLVSDIELLMAFFESFDASADYGNENGLEDLSLGTVHTAGTGQNQKIAMLDTPVDFYHPLLSGKLVSVPVPGLRSAALFPDPNPDDPEAYGHGTHIAGLISMVAPAARIYPMAVLGTNGIGNTTNVAAALQKIYDMRHDPSAPVPISVINMSISFEAESRVVREAVAALIADGVKVVAGAGNTGFGTSEVVYPAAYPGVIAVGSSSDGLLVADFSARGAVDIGTPGVDLVSAYPGSQMWTASGTSMSCAIMTGALAVLQGPCDTQADLSDPVGRLLSTSSLALPQGAWVNGNIAILNALQMMELAKQ